MYSVNHWGSHPDSNNDDCWSGEDFDTLEAAKEYFAKSADSDTMYIELDGHDIYKVRKNPAYKPKPRHDYERREAAIQAGMAFGCEGYNEVMGY